MTLSTSPRRSETNHDINFRLKIATLVRVECEMPPVDASRARWNCLIFFLMYTLGRIVSICMLTFPFLIIIHMWKRDCVTIRGLECGSHMKFTHNFIYFLLLQPYHHIVERPSCTESAQHHAKKDHPAWKLYQRSPTAECKGNSRTGWT